MNTFLMGEYDVIVVGAGHAGCEAALAPARMGLKTLMLSMTLESIAMMPCNPSIGGTGKGHLVREIDALGGEMGINIDKAFIQSTMLNTSKGPAVHSLRAQADKQQYHYQMKKTMEAQENLDIKQAEVVDLLVENGKACGVVVKTGAKYMAKAVILATGTYLGGKIFIGESVSEGGPNGLAAANELSSALEREGIGLRRFKTGTPARVDGKTINYDKTIPQYGDEKNVPFSFMNDPIEKEQIQCYLTYTNEKTHEVIKENLHRSALYGGKIVGIGPRYCPSIEDKVVRFADKERHQTFIEPEGLYTDEMYVQGMSTSLPEDVQLEFYRTIAGLEDVKIVRPAYAIEYDCIDSTTLKLSLEHRKVENLFCAGQFNGSSGYEEAAAQGLIAGINAALKIQGREPLILDRSEAYIGVLIDDLVTKGTSEPYRIMTSRAEYRLLLRQDNADLRLTEKGREIGLVSDERYNRFLVKKQMVEQELARLENTFLGPKDADAFLDKYGSTPLKQKASLKDLLKRPQISYENLLEIDPDRPLDPYTGSPLVSGHIAEQVEVQIKYSGYIEKQLQQVERFKKLESRRLSPDLDYDSMDGLRIEARQKLSRLKPLSVGQASRISGVSPADINVLLIHLERMKRTDADK
ncbi:MAG: tRNA uridine-5-carboxymethylaminomethyl(34) synthesis enzyme MnmG [Bacillota bacterium]|nr:tRNA uridine-5-carboxymethylaminomethyl(34) synthesis enzyme MnmG [Bacillota bacterium]